MNWLDPWLLAPAAVLLLAACWWLARFGRGVQLERARESLRLQGKRLEQQFLEAARRTGKPRGLRWAGCEFAGDFELARDRATRRIVAFVPVIVQFEAVEGGDLEGVPAVDQPKTACALFVFERGTWVTTGRAVFNLPPPDAIRQLHAHYDPIPAGH
jgi:hypothetical protein